MKPKLYGCSLNGKEMIETHTNIQGNDPWKQGVELGIIK
jgi:hypothetical protein